MKKVMVFALVVFVGIFTGCEMYKTHKVVIKNTSMQTATLRVKNYKEGDKKILESFITIEQGKTTSLYAYNDCEIKLESTGRNYLTGSGSLYQILNSKEIIFNVKNVTSEKVNLSDANNLFDPCEINADETKKDLKVFNPEKLQPVAITDTEKIKLRTSIQTTTIIIAY